MPPPFTDVGAVFPSKGLERTCEFGRQPADTAPDGENVLSEESITSRVRGGSRPGLSKYINETVVGDFVVQHINVLVDPQATALRAETSTPGGVPDPSTNNVTMRNPGRVVTSGGSGRVPNRNIPDGPGSGNAVEFVQVYREQPGVINATTTFTLPSQPVANSLVVVIIRTSKVGTAVGEASLVTNSNLNQYEQVGGNGYTSDVTSNHNGIPGQTATNSISVWTKRATAGAADQEIRVTPGGTGFIYELVAIEVRNAGPIQPVTNQSRGSNAASVPSFTAGSLALNNTTGQMVIAAFTLIDCSATIGGAYVHRVGHFTTGAPYSGNMVVGTLGNLSGAGPEEAVATPVVSRPYAAFSVAIQKQQ